MASIQAWMRKPTPGRGSAAAGGHVLCVLSRVVKGEGPIGAEKVLLTPERSLAVDPSYIPLGVPIWLDAVEQFATNQNVGGC